MGDISAESADVGTVGRAWDDLVGRACPNVFLDPIALAAAQGRGFAAPRILAAWHGHGASRALAGLWALQRSRSFPLFPATLSAPPYEYAFLSAPVIEPPHLDAVLAAFFNAIESDPTLPKVIRIKALAAESGCYDAMLRVLARRGRGRALTLSEWQRPFVSIETGQKRSGSTRKKLRQDWNRLSASGSAEVVNVVGAADVADAFETFLALEAASWKGNRGTALLCKETDAAFSRRLMTGLSARGKASVALLKLDGKPIAAQVLLYCARTAFTWKTAYDPAYGGFSPGALLIDRAGELLFLRGDIDDIESCSPATGVMSQLWPGRRKTVDLLVDVTASRSLAFQLAKIEETSYVRLRRWRKDMQSRARLLAPRLNGLARPARPAAGP